MNAADRGRKFTTDPLIPKSIKLTESMWAAIDAARGQQSVTGFIRDAVKSELYYDGKPELAGG